MSAKRIVQPVIFDNLKNAVPGGLYDSHMGPVDMNGRWVATWVAAAHVLCAFGRVLSLSLAYFCTLLGANTRSWGGILRTTPYTLPYPFPSLPRSLPRT